MTTSSLRRFAVAIATLAIAGSAMATASAAPLVERSAPSTATCKQGGECVLGDEGPGGGLIIYVRKPIAIVTIDVLSSIRATVTTSEPHGLIKDDTVALTGVTPSSFNTTSVLVDAVENATRFIIAGNFTPVTSASGGTVNQSVGEWDYIQAAPKGWSGSETDPYVGGPAFPGLNGVTLDWRLGSGGANTAKMKAQYPNNTAANDFSHTINTYAKAAGWYIPSSMELLRMYRVLGANAAIELQQGMSAHPYVSSTFSFFDNAFGPLWSMMDFSKNLVDNEWTGLGVQSGTSDPLAVRPVRTLFAHRAQTNLTVAAKVGLGKTVTIASLSPQGVPVSIRVLSNSRCAVTEPVKKNRSTFFTVRGGKQAGTCKLAITAPKTDRYWAHSQQAVLQVK